MLLLNIEQLLKTRGVDNASRYLVQQGMKYHTINRLLTGKIDKMTHATVEQLCLRVTAALMTCLYGNRGIMLRWLLTKFPEQANQLQQDHDR